MRGARSVVPTGAALGEATCNVHTMAHSSLGKGNTRVSGGDPHRHHSADGAVGSSSQGPANPALGWPKGGVRHRDDGLKNIPTCNKGSKACMALRKHLYITDDAK